MKDRFNKRIHLSGGILKKIAQIDEFKGLWRGTGEMNPHILKQLQALVIITSTGASTRIEGSAMSDEEVARLLRGLKAKQPKGRDEEEVAGYADLLGRVFDHYPSLKLTEGQILQFHEILLHFAEKDVLHKGKYKPTDNVVVIRNPDGEDVVLFRPTPPYLVKKEMGDVISWTNENIDGHEFHPLLVISNFIFEFLAIHPFHDGNGRLSRALTNLLLLQSGYAHIPYISLEEIIEERKTDYYLSLRQTQKNHKTDNEDISAWVNFMLDALIEQTLRAQVLLDAKQPEKLLSEKQIIVYGLFAAGNILGTKEITERLAGEVAESTIKKTLSRLVELKLLERLGSARSTRYRKKYES
ncbi:Fic family protein [Candidatus Kaiserbacteria bacterium]|nr:Fic family protein [Candidatus Kaiserbacteria bacterium]